MLWNPPIEGDWIFLLERGNSFLDQNIKGNWVPAAEAFPLDCSLCVWLVRYLSLPWDLQAKPPENSELTNQWGWQFSANFLLKEPTCALFAFLIRILLESGFYLQGHRRKPSHSCAPWTCGPFRVMQKVDSVLPVSLPLDSRQQLEGGANSFPTEGSFLQDNAHTHFPEPVKTLGGDACNML